MKVTQPKVSIVAITYNHEKYIREALDGFLKQATTFDYEIVIADDCSTDGTQKIIQEYANRHPGVFKPILRKKNIGAQRNFIDALQHARGEYIALCEGDDYWTAESKLQNQVDFLDKHKDYAVCFHKVRIIYTDGKQPDQIYPDVEDQKWYTLEQLFDINFIQTNSVMYRAQDYTNLPVTMMPGDWFMHLYHARLGKIKLLDETMSVYRKHAEGMWWDYDVNRDKIWQKHAVAHLAMWIELGKLYTDAKHLKRINKHIQEMMNTIIRIDQSYDQEHLKQVLTEYPETFIDYVHIQYKTEQQKDKEVEMLADSVSKKDHELLGLSGLVQQKDQELHKIKSTKLWRTRIGIAKAYYNLGISKKPKSNL